MSDLENLTANLEYDAQMKKLKEEVLQRFSDYRKTIAFMAADAPISILCLPRVIENALLAHGCLRVYDLLNCDFTEIKGLGAVRIRNLTARLDEFLAML
jgi:hypothetical protein